ncbi:hypothetical protein [Deefgea piscis]|uniref:hypothetical protein n=1 Tax=Deefgea piscis TaxID=2739061 RepID=UPI001C7F79E3|nr:hypothetical protein [Deefgea piscis]QZA80686.1 hypothetical protein K4H25_14470 [Deefgea piscis]
MQIREDYLDPTRACELMQQQDNIELLPLLRYQFCDGIHRGIYSVRLLPDAQLLILRGDGISPEELVDRAQEAAIATVRLGPALRAVLFDLRGLLTDYALTQIFQATQSHLWPMRGAIDVSYDSLSFLLEEIDSLTFALPTQLFQPEMVGLLCMRGDARREMETPEEIIEKVQGNAVQLFAWLRSLASDTAPLLRERLTLRVISELRHQPAFGVHGDGFSSMWAEYCDVLASDSMLGEVVDSQLELQVHNELSKLSQQERVFLWLDSDDSSGWERDCENGLSELVPVPKQINLHATTRWAVEEIHRLMVREVIAD